MKDKFILVTSSEKLSEYSLMDFSWTLKVAWALVTSQFLHQSERLLLVCRQLDTASAIRKKLVVFIVNCNHNKLTRHFKIIPQYFLKSCFGEVIREFLFKWELRRCQPRRYDCKMHHTSINVKCNNKWVFVSNTIQIK